METKRSVVIIRREPSMGCLVVYLMMVMVVASMFGCALLMLRG